MVDWNPPAHNADKVQQYIIYNQVGHNNKFVEVKREVSYHEQIVPLE